MRATATAAATLSNNQCSILISSDSESDSVLSKSDLPDTNYNSKLSNLNHAEYQAAVILDTLLLEASSGYPNSVEEDSDDD